MLADGGKVFLCVCDGRKSSKFIEIDVEMLTWLIVILYVIQYVAHPQIRVRVKVDSGEKKYHKDTLHWIQFFVSIVRYLGSIRH